MAVASSVAHESDLGLMARRKRAVSTGARGSADPSRRPRGAPAASKTHRSAAGATPLLFGAIGFVALSVYLLKEPWTEPSRRLPLWPLFLALGGLWACGGIAMLVLVGNEPAPGGGEVVPVPRAEWERLQKRLRSLSSRAKGAGPEAVRDDAVVAAGPDSLDPGAAEEGGRPRPEVLRAPSFRAPDGEAASPNPERTVPTGASGGLVADSPSDARTEVAARARDLIQLVETLRRESGASPRPWAEDGATPPPDASRAPGSPRPAEGKSPSRRGVPGSAALDRHAERAAGAPPYSEDDPPIPAVKASDLGLPRKAAAPPPSPPSIGGRAASRSASPPLGNACARCGRASGASPDPCSGCGRGVCEDCAGPLEGPGKPRTCRDCSARDRGARLGAGETNQAQADGQPGAGGARRAS